MLTSN